MAQAVTASPGRKPSIGRFVGCTIASSALEGNDLADNVEAADAHLFTVAPTRQVDAKIGPLISRM